MAPVFLAAYAPIPFRGFAAVGSGLAAGVSAHFGWVAPVDGKLPRMSLPILRLAAAAGRFVESFIMGRVGSATLHCNVLTLYSDKVPLRLAPKAFDAIVERAVAAIPGRFRARMHNLVIVVQPVGPSPDLLGLYEGRPATERSVSDFSPLGPDRIRIFQRPHEEMARNAGELERIVTDTVWHEIGHYFGLSEREIHAAEDRRERLRPLRRAARLAKSSQNR